MSANPSTEFIEQHGFRLLFRNISGTVFKFSLLTDFTYETAEQNDYYQIAALKSMANVLLAVTVLVRMYP